jgi:hypothetical protein
MGGGQDAAHDRRLQSFLLLFFTKEALACFFV